MTFNQFDSDQFELHYDEARFKKVLMTVRADCLNAIFLICETGSFLIRTVLRCDHSICTFHFLRVRSGPLEDVQ